MLHIPDEDVSDAVALADLTPEQRRVIDLLELNPAGRSTVRLTWGQWRWVNRVVVELGALGVSPVREGAGSGLSADLRAEVPRPRVSGPGERAGSYVTNEREQA